MKIELCAVCVLHLHFFRFKPSDHEVYQSAGAGSADRHRGEGPLYLRDRSGKRRFYYKREGAEQRWVPGIRSVASFKKQVDFENCYHSSFIISNHVWFVYSRGNCGPKADRQHSGIHWRDQFPERSGGCWQVLQNRTLMQHAYYVWQRMKSMLNRTVEANKDNII